MQSKRMWAPHFLTVCNDHCAHQDSMVAPSWASLWSCRCVNQDQRIMLPRTQQSVPHRTDGSTIRCWSISYMTYTAKLIMASWVTIKNINIPSINCRNLFHRSHRIHGCSNTRTDVFQRLISHRNTQCAQGHGSQLPVVMDSMPTATAKVDHTLQLWKWCIRW